MYLVTDSELRKRLIECLTEIPYEHIKLTADLVDYISSHIDGQLNESLIITLSDHISFAIERKSRDLNLKPAYGRHKRLLPEGAGSWKILRGGDISAFGS